MNELLSVIPPSGGWHPLLIHFPVVLLPLTTMFLIASLVWKRERVVMTWIALALMVMGAFGCYIAVVTGEDAKEHATISKENTDAIQQHEDKAEDVWLIFSVLAGLYAGIVWGVQKYPVLAEKYFVIVSILFSLCYIVALTQLVLAGHLGATLVHKYGIHAVMR